MPQLSQVTIESKNTRGTAALAYRVEVASRSLLTLSMRALSQLDAAISAPQLRALMVLDQLGCSNLGTLAEALGVSPSSTSRLVDRLVATGLMAREVAAHSRREVQLQLTAGGRRMLRRHDEVRRAVFAEALADLSEPDLLALVQGLDAVRALGER